MKFRFISGTFVCTVLVFTLACGGDSAPSKVPTPTPITSQELLSMSDEQRKTIATDWVSKYITDISPGKFRNSTNVLSVGVDQENLKTELTEIETELKATKEFYPAMEVKYQPDVLILKGVFSAYYYGRPQELHCYFYFNELTKEITEFDPATNDDCTLMEYLRKDQAGFKHD